MVGRGLRIGGRVRLALIAGLAVLLSACTPSPQPIHFGEDACAYCVMTISDERYGAQIVTTKGKVHKFDSIECMAGYELEGRDGTDHVHSRWVVDRNQPTTLIPLDDAAIVHSESIHSPMGLSLAAFGNSAPEVLTSIDGHVMSWEDVRALVRSEWSVDVARPAHH